MEKTMDKKRLMEELICKAKDPELARRSTCTLSTLIRLNAKLAA